MNLLHYKVPVLSHVINYIVQYICNFKRIARCSNNLKSFQDIIPITYINLKSQPKWVYPLDISIFYYFLWKTLIIYVCKLYAFIILFQYFEQYTFHFQWYPTKIRVYNGQYSILNNEYPKGVLSILLIGQFWILVIKI